MNGSIEKLPAHHFSLFAFHVSRLTFTFHDKMIRELLHFVVHAPETLALSRRLLHPQLYDTLMLRAEDRGMSIQRASLLENLHGDVLEIGCGTGLMFPYYPNEVCLAAVELIPDFLDLAKSRARKSDARISLFLGDGAQLPFSEQRFDFVIFGLVLCSVRSVAEVLKETRRVLKPDGEIRLVEHVRSAQPVHGAVMDALNPLWKFLNQQNCHMNRRTEALLEENGFRVTESRPFKIFSPGMPAFPMRWLRAVAK
jgi:SAM-dependent methyltransferase